LPEAFFGISWVISTILEYMYAAKQGRQKSISSVRVISAYEVVSEPFLKQDTK
jgi:hypothetical protein